MIEAWHEEIVKGVLIQQRIEELDAQNLWTHHLPAIAASEDELTATEARLGFAIDPAYRRFLRYANGWRCFHQDLDLFGTQQLLGAPPAWVAHEILGAIEPELFEGLVGMAVNDVMVLGASEVQTDLYLLAQPWSPAPGQVMWFANELIERCPDFDEFFLTMLDYNRYTIQQLEGQA